MLKKEMVVVGSGPSGMAASIEAAKRGVEVLVLDENNTAGGQLFKQIHKFFGTSTHYAGVRGFNIGKELLEQFKQYGVELWLNSRVVGLFDDNCVMVEQGKEGTSKTLHIIKGNKIVLATGGAEKPISFKGWTLPGVMGAGAAQTMINVCRVLPGKKVLMVGSGNVGLIVTYQLLQAGIESAVMVEAAPKIGGYSVHASKIRRAGVQIYKSCTVLEARGESSVEEATICHLDGNGKYIDGTEKIVDVDLITIAAGLRPSIKLAQMYDCACEYFPELGGWTVLHDENMETTCPGVYVAGDSSGVEEANTALDEGRVAGLAIAQSLGKLSHSEGEKLKADVWERLNGLRMGPFGHRRLSAKKNIMRMKRDINATVKK
jgi:NADPH-dependent 2,4-dienoyl-CoA reductase/sulfur reductase-like enzyme